MLRKIYTEGSLACYLGLQQWIHRNCSNTRPLACMHAVHRLTTDCRVRSKINGMSAMVSAATVILATRSFSVSTTVSHISCFMCPQKRKSRHVRSGDLGGQATRPPRPIHRLQKVALRWFLTAMLKWVGAISIHRSVYQMHVSHFSMHKPFHVPSQWHRHNSLRQHH